MEELIAVYEQYCQQVRHHQEERRTIANTLLVVIGALIAVAAIDQHLDSNDAPIAIMLIVAGVFGAACMVKCHGLVKFYKNVAENLAVQLNLGNGSTVRDIEDRTIKNFNKFWKTVHKIRLWYLWVLLFLFIALASSFLLAFKI